MSKVKLVAFAAMVLCMLCVSVYAGEIVAVPTSSVVLVNGEKVEVQAYNIEGSNYFKLRDVACLLDNSDFMFEVEYDKEANSITILRNKKYTAVGGELAKSDGKPQSVAPTALDIYVGSTQVNVEAYNIDGSNYFKLRDLSDGIGFGVEYDQATDTITISTIAPEPEKSVSEKMIADALESDSTPEGSPAADYTLYMKYILWGEDTKTNKLLAERFTDEQIEVIKKYYANSKFSLEYLKEIVYVPFYMINELTDETLDAWVHALLTATVKSIEFTVSDVSIDGKTAVVKTVITKMLDEETTLSSIISEIYDEFMGLPSGYIDYDASLDNIVQRFTKALSDEEKWITKETYESGTLEMVYLPNTGWVAIIDE